MTAPVPTPIGAVLNRLDGGSRCQQANGFPSERLRIGCHLKSPANNHIPLLLVDVDGVISLFGFDLDARPDGTFHNVDGIHHYLSATAGEHLRALAESFELVWCTGWEERANEHLPHALGLPGPYPFLTFAAAPGVSARHWKLDAIDAYAGPNRPVAWIDDDHARCQDWARDRPGPTLLVTSDPAVGITTAHVEELLTWAASLRR
ncbi:MAG TPA: HAD domain-containing protein [Solirubrobacteraceae bacterium]|nr:HAD domain-containing protein [Solirubrobacteraceae bacterium]